MHQYELSFIFKTERLTDISEVEDLAHEIAKQVNREHVFSDEIFTVNEMEPVSEQV